MQRWATLCTAAPCMMSAHAQNTSCSLLPCPRLSQRHAMDICAPHSMLLVYITTTQATCSLPCLGSVEGIFRPRPQSPAQSAGAASPTYRSPSFLLHLTARPAECTLLTSRGRAARQERGGGRHEAAAGSGRRRQPARPAARHRRPPRSSQASALLQHCRAPAMPCPALHTQARLARELHVTGRKLKKSALGGGGCSERPKSALLGRRAKSKNG